MAKSSSTARPGRKGPHEDPLPDDGDWSYLRPGDDGYDPALARSQVALVDRPTRDFDDLPTCGIFFGPQLGFSPRREGYATSPGRTVPASTREVVHYTADGTRCVAEVCSQCGNGLLDVRLRGRTLCAGCWKAGDESIDVRALVLAELAASKLPARDAQMRAAEAEVIRKEAAKRLARKLAKASRMLVVLRRVPA